MEKCNAGRCTFYYWLTDCNWKLINIQGQRRTIVFTMLVMDGVVRRGVSKEKKWRLGINERGTWR